MNKKTITPNPQKPVERKLAGQLPSALAELSEAALSDTHALPNWHHGIYHEHDTGGMCSYDGDEE